MKRFLVLLLAVSSVALAAQEKPKLRGRFGSHAVGASGLNIAISGPSLSPTVTVSASTLVLSGTAFSTSGAGLSSVTWSCATCSPTSGSAILAPNGDWISESASSAATVGLDTFNSASSVALSSTVADTTGGAWSEVVNNTAGAAHISRRSVDYIQPNTSVTTLVSPLMINLLATNPAISGTNYDVSVKLVHDSGVGADDGAAIVFGYQDSSNYCAALWYGATAATDMYLLKRVAGVLTVLDSDNFAPALNDVLEVEVRGTSLVLTQNGISRLTATDGDCDNAVGVGVGFGAFRDVTTDDATTASKLDDFTVVDQDGTNSAISLAAGANTIVVTVTDALSATSTDTIVVTYTTPDATDPIVTITGPVAESTYNTSSSSVTLSGTATDNTAVTSVTYACSGATTIGSTEATFTAPNWSGPITVNEGTTNCTVTAVDAVTNDAIDTIAIVYAPADVTNPTITITTSSPVTTTTSPVTITGTAADTGGSGLAAVEWTCDVCPSGSASGTSNWSANATVGIGANILSFRSRDVAGNLSSVTTITVNNNPTPMVITTASMPNGRVSEAYPATTLARQGGTAPFTWTNNAAGTSLNDSDAHCAGLAISSAGVVTGTPTTAGTCDWTAKVTDNVAATDTQALSIVVATAGAEGPHDFFTTLVARGDCWKAFSLRPLAGQTATVTTCGQSRYEKQLLRAGLGGYAQKGSTVPLTMTYCFTGSEPSGSCPSADTHAQKQDAAKLALPAWISFEGRTLASNINSSVTTIPLSSTQSIVAGGGIKIDNEVMLFPSGTTYISANPVVIRGAFGTTAASHTAGAAVARNSNVNENQVYLPLNTIGNEDANYLFIWDTYFTDSWIPTKHGLQVHKTFHFNSSAGDDNWFRADAGYVPYAEDNVSGIFNPVSDVGVVRGRRLFGMTYPPSIPEPPADDHQPMLPWGDNGGAAVIKPNLWGRWFVYIETQAEGDPANFTTVTTINAAISSTTATTITIACSVASFGPGCKPFTLPQVIAGGTGGNAWPGRSIKIDNEIMTVTSGVSSGDTATLTVVRGAYGTTAATHSSGANVGVVHDFITLWYADENNNAVELLDRYPAHLDENHATVTTRGALLRLRIEVSTSTDTIQQERMDSGQQDLVMYLRNFAILKNPPADWSSLRVKPVR